MVMSWEEQDDAINDLMMLDDAIKTFLETGISLFLVGLVRMPTHPPFCCDSGGFWTYKIKLDGVVGKVAFLGCCWLAGIDWSLLDVSGVLYSYLVCQ
jgi:hypothetical protein